MSDESLKRLDRIVAILIQLQSKRVIKAQEIADRFGVSLRTIYRDVRTLEATGVPIYSEAGVGYSLMEGYRLPPIMFTREEATSFVAAEKLMQKYMDKQLGEHFTSAMYKVRAVLRLSDKEWMSSIASQMRVQLDKPVFNSDVPHALSTLMESIARKKQIRLSYQALKAEEASERIIEPVGITHENQYWYVVAYCHLRQAYRNFRTDRIHRIHLLDVSFTQEHPPLEAFQDRVFMQETTQVVIRMPNDVARYIHWDRNHYGYVSETVIGEETEMVFNSRDPENGFARWFLMFADKARILAPEHVKLRVRELLHDGLAQLG